MFGLDGFSKKEEEIIADIVKYEMGKERLREYPHCASRAYVLDLIVDHVQRYHEKPITEVNDKLYMLEESNNINADRIRDLEAQVNVLLKLLTKKV
jgi:hypothetical protein